MDQQYLDIVKRYVLDYCLDEDVKVLIYGSVARGEYQKGSDLDIAVLSSVKLKNGFLSKLKEGLDNLNIPFKVDLINIAEVSKDFRENVLKDAVIWKD